VRAVRTPIIDKNGRATTVYKSSPSGVSKPRPLPAIPQPREVAPAYDADVYYAMRTEGDYLVCGACGWRRIYASETVRADDRVAHATPIRNPSSLDISCSKASWDGALATAAIQRSR
jgi:hypothetical protein